MRMRSSDREDYLMRLIREAGLAVARLRARLTGKEAPPEVIRADAEAAVEALLGPEEPLLRRLDAQSAVQLIDHRERVAWWVALLDVQAEAADASGDATAATALRNRAHNLRVAAKLDTKPNT